MGRQALYYDDYVTAIHYFNVVLEAKPYLAEAYYYRAYSKFSLEDYESAEKDLDQAILFNPFKIEFYSLRGLCRIHNLRYDDAIQDYTRTLEESPEDQGAHYNRVLCRLETKDFETAHRELNFILQRWPKFTRAYLVKAQACFATADTLEGLRWVDSLLVLSKRESGAWGFKARYALQHEEYALADSFYTQALKYDIGNPDYFLERAQTRTAMSRYNLALADYDRLIEMIPQHFVAHYNRGIIRSTIGDDNRAIQDFDFVIQEEPDNVLAIYNRAELRQKVGDFYGAISDYSYLIKAYPNFVYGYVQRAQCYRTVGSVAKALRDEAVVQRADYDLIFGNGKRKDMKTVRKRSDKELERYDELIAEETDTTRTFMSEFSGKVQNRKVERVFLPTYHAEDNHLLVEGARQPIFTTDEELISIVNTTNRLVENSAEGALNNLKRVISEGHDQEPVLYYNLGCLEAEAGSLEAAEAAFAKAYELDPQMAEALYNRAVIYLLQEETDKATPLLSKAGEMGLFKAYNLLKQAKQQKK